MMFRHLIAGIVLSVLFLTFMYCAGTAISLILILVYLAYCCFNWWGFLLFPFLAVFLLLFPFITSVFAVVVFLAACLLIKEG